MNKRNIKIIILTGIIVLFIIIVAISKNLTNLKKKEIFIEFINETSDILINNLSYETISGNSDFTLKVDSDITKKIIIPKTNYNSNYQIDLNKGYANIKLEGQHKEGILKSNIYISNNKINILLEDVHEKYISYNIDKLDIFTNSNNYKVVIETLSKTLIENIKLEYFDFDKTKIDGKSINVITLNLSNKNYEKFLQENYEKLNKDKKFKEALFEITGFQGEDLKSLLDIFSNKNYKITLYIEKESDNFRSIKFEDDENEIIINNEDNKFVYEYYLRDGLMYSGFIKITNDKIKEITLIDQINHWRLNLDFKEVNVKYNEKIKEKKINSNEIVDYTNDNKDIKKIISDNKILNEIQENYDKKDESSLKLTEEEIIRATYPDDYFD